MIFRLQIIVSIVALSDVLHVTGFFFPKIRHTQAPFVPSYSSASRTSMYLFPQHDTVLQIKQELEAALAEQAEHDLAIKNELDMKRRLLVKNTIKKRCYDRRVKALIRYKELYGDMLVPSNFSVPDSHDWPAESWKLQLGKFVGLVRNTDAYSDKTEELMSLGFEFVPRFNSKYGFDLIKQALLRYKELYGDLTITATYIIPCTDEWPSSMWDMKLGCLANNVRRGSSYADKKDELLEIGFDYESQHKYGYDLVKQGLLRYKEINGHINVPARFFIPVHEEWSSELWNLKLGSVVHDIRRGSYSDKKSELLDMGFVYVLRKKFDYECVRIAIYKYRELNHGCTKVPAVYNIPQNDLWYPEETWGMCLGSYARRIKSGQIWPDKFSDLFSPQ